MWFLFYRLWTGFSEQFPIAAFDGLEDNQIEPKRKELGVAWAAAHQERLVEYLIKEHDPLEEEAIVAAREELLGGWLAANPSQQETFSKLRREQVEEAVREQRARRNGSVMSLGAMRAWAAHARAPEPAKEVDPIPAAELIEKAAGWRPRRTSIVLYGPFGKGVGPGCSERHYFFGLHDEYDPRLVVDALNLRAGEIQPPRTLVSTRLRADYCASDSMSAAEQLALIARLQEGWDNDAFPYQSGLARLTLQILPHVPSRQVSAEAASEQPVRAEPTVRQLAVLKAMVGFATKLSPQPVKSIQGKVKGKFPKSQRTVRIELRALEALGLVGKSGNRWFITETGLPIVRRKPAADPERPKGASNPF